MTLFIPAEVGTLEAPDHALIRCLRCNHHMLASDLYVQFLHEFSHPIENP